jgi:hypothetical protein
MELSSILIMLQTAAHRSLLKGEGEEKQEVDDRIPALSEA